MVLKLQAIVLARNGWIAREIAEALGKSTRTIHNGSVTITPTGSKGCQTDAVVTTAI